MHGLWSSTIHPIREFLIQMNSMVVLRSLKVQPDYSFETAPLFDIVIIPGGYGADHIEIENPVVINWIQARSSQTEILASVCTGSFLLAKAGLLDNRKATTHWMDIKILQIKFPKVHVLSNVKYVDEGSIITSAGISAGIQMSLHIVRRLLSEEIVTNRKITS
ncbi:DJ-1/PfpI family protein [Paraliobacillus sediminis]|uniref:DJ-1/PfpI family protein n=1 Tax=Paraliobacillus sediminis TaxID=1885916 RepID=UPI001F07E437|nr:DJ-1/PfpI family protein [Paraliobacillus sediminis]